MAAARAYSDVLLFNVNNAKFYSKYLSYTDGFKPKFLWSGTKENLWQFINDFFQNEAKDDSDNSTAATSHKWAEDPAHNMVSFRCAGLTFKLYQTTKTLVIKGKDEQQAKSKLFASIPQNCQKVSEDVMTADRLRQERRQYCRSVKKKWRQS